MLPVVWVLGISGVGKSTVGHRVLTELDSVGLVGAFVDADQLRLASGVRASETGLIASSLPEVSRAFEVRGARVLIVAGVVDDARNLAELLPGLPRELVLAVHLGADEGTLRERVLERGWRVEPACAALADASYGVPDFVDLSLDTVGRGPDELAALVADAGVEHLRRRAGGRPLETPAVSSQRAAGPGRLVVLTGPGGVGLSTSGYELFSRLAREGSQVGYVDAHQVGFLGGDVDAAERALLQAQNTLVVVDSLVRGGAATVVLSGDPGTVALLAGPSGEVDGADVFWVHGSSHVLAERITASAQGRGPAIPGGRRTGLVGEALREAVVTAVEESRRRDVRVDGSRWVDSTGLSAVQVAEVVAMALSR